MRLPVLLISIFFYQALQAQIVLFEEDFSAGIPSSWYLVNSDNLTPAAAVDTFDNAWISFISDGDTCAASTSFYDPAGQSADYLITPRITLDAFSKLVWSARSYDASYPDGYIVLISTTDSAITSFTDTIFVKPEENFYWHSRSVQLDAEGYANEDVFIAFKNTTTNGFILMIDNVKILGSDFVSFESNGQEMISVYPNPVMDFVTISKTSAEDVVVIYDLQGHELIRTLSNRIDMSTLSPGIYVYSVFSDSGCVASGKLNKL